MSEQVDILIATYQGGNYVEEQIESILLQTHFHVNLIIRDDGSTDETPSILMNLNQTYPNKITLLPSEKHLGIKGNFSTLMQHSRAPYLAFSDQDDKWLPHKIEESLDLIKSMERQYGSHLPLLVHTDLTLVDQNLKEMAPSFWRYENFNPDATGFNRLLVQNVVTGCTMLMNRCLADLAQPIPPEAVMHDWWVGLVASCFGHIQSLEKPTVLYRQHETNHTGAKGYSLWNLFGEEKNSSWLPQTFAQARDFLERYRHSLPQEIRDLIKDYLSIEQLPYLKQKQLIIKHHFFEQGFLRNLRSFLSKQ